MAETLTALQPVIARLGCRGQVCSSEGAETRLLIPSPDRHHWLHHFQNNVRRAVREGVLDPREEDPDRRFSERESAARRRRHRQLIFGL